MENERIVDGNTRITNETLLKLQSYLHAIEQQERTEKGFAATLPWFGRFILVSVILSFFFAAMRTYRPELFYRNSILLLFSSLILLIIGISHLFVITFEFSEYLIPFISSCIELLPL